ncbi:MAG: hypothetical protein AAFR23_04740 [Pseudomonadota bacterium]
MPFVFDATPDAVSVYEVNANDTQNDAPHTDPIGNINRVKFHSNFNYPEVVEEHVFSVALPARSKGRQGSSKYILGQHGRGFVPILLASADVGGVFVALAGTIPVQQTEIAAFPRTVAIGADETNVFLYERYATASHDRLNRPNRFFEYDAETNPTTEYGIIERSFDLPAITLTIRVLVLDINVEAPPTAPSGADMVEITPQALRVPKSGFDTDKRYLRAVPTGQFALPRGATFAYDFSPKAWALRFGARHRPDYINNACRWSFRLGQYEQTPQHVIELRYQGANIALRYHAPPNASQSYAISA